MSQTILVNGQPVAVDREGFLLDLQDWSEAAAAALAAQEGITLTAAHLEVLLVLRDFYHTYQLSPAMRPLVKYVGQQLGKEKGTSLYLLSLFPGSPAKFAAKLAGLPKPDNCL
ncbi:TusE/DsrC/DsvC family sulfur relay protein [Halopseudomonas sp.]|uniref:TusE/DsrC/DsvC family sulfur relay protein n=1 Tax=Halopseudomonas sp. TaxID=2901191 RepID=UPI0030013C7A